jgi:hypothetical protein
MLYPLKTLASALQVPRGFHLGLKVISVATRDFSPASIRSNVLDVFLVQAAVRHD